MQIASLRQEGLEAISTRKKYRAAVAASSDRNTSGSSTPCSTTSSATTLLDLLLDAQDVGAGSSSPNHHIPLSDEELLDNAVTFIFAGAEGCVAKS